MGLFDKKKCPRCGAEVHWIDLTKKTAEGTLCGECTKLLSPYWDNTKKCTLADIDKHLEYRDANLERLKTEFKPDKNAGYQPTLFMDTVNRLWCISFEDGGYLVDNPDLFTYAQLKKFDFNTPSGDTSFFTFHIIDHPYIEKIELTSNDVPTSTMRAMCDLLFDVEAYNKEQRKLARKK